jgi:hypothetical protein
MALEPYDHWPDCRSYRNWHISRGEPDDAGRPPLKAVFFSHDCDDGGYRIGWADTLEEAMALIDAMPDYGDLEWDYR